MYQKDRMKIISEEETKNIEGGIVPLVISGARLAWAAYRFSRVPSAATWAARGAGIIGTTYQTAKFLDEKSNKK